MKRLLWIALCAAMAAAGPVAAQGQSAEANMQILRDKLKADKKLLVAENMQLSDAEAKGFWPVYDAYQKDMQALNDRLGKAILAYADGYNKNSLTDEQATKLTSEVIAIEESEVKLRKSYSDRLAKVLPGRKVARYLQIENKIRAQVRYELAAQIPLVK
jgi:hypothetical protein